MAKELSFGYSPCPNDTFMFNALATGQVAVEGYPLNIELHDVETLNGLAMDGVLDVSKLSCYAWMAVKSNYRLLNNGAAMGFGCGPLLIAKHPLKRSDINHCRVVLPGQWTTAHLLFRLWAPDASQRCFVPYDRIFNALASGEADCGVIIHESRFTFASAGFTSVVDLGSWWEAKTGLPIPLGCIAARQHLGEPLHAQIDAAISRSIRRALADPVAAVPYIRQYALEMDDEVLQAHIRTFVNDFSLDLPPQGHAAIRTLESMAHHAGAL